MPRDRAFERSARRLELRLPMIGASAGGLDDAREKAGLQHAFGTARTSSPARCAESALEVPAGAFAAFFGPSGSGRASVTASSPI